MIVYRTKHNFDTLLENRLDVFNIAREYYEIEHDYTSELEEMINRWRAEGDFRKLQILRAVGINI